MADKITRLGVAGFKSAMDPVDINIRDITILAGQNSAGKSTLIQPALMIKQTLEQPFDSGGLAIDGPLVKFTNGDQFLSRARKAKQQNTKRNMTFELHIGTDDNNYSIEFKGSKNGGLTPSEMRFDIEKMAQKWTVGQTLTPDDPSLGPVVRRAFSRRLTAGLGVDHIPDHFRVVRTRCWLSATIAQSNSPLINSGFGSYSPISGSIRSLQRMIHLPGLRGNPERDYRISGVGPDITGNFADYVASIIYMWAEKKDERLDKLGTNLRSLGLTWKVMAKRLDDTRLEIRVGRLSAGAQGGAYDTVNIADVGFGVSQILPVLVALLAAEKDQLVFIEQPEIHLHPRAQSALAELIREAADRGVRVIIETHSSLLLLALQTLISEGRLQPDRVSFNWFTRTPNGQTEVAEAEIRHDGSYGDWPVDFGSIESQVDNRYLNSVDLFRSLHTDE
jgi:predicted ATPase